jgi:hypothetical protein
LWRRQETVTAKPTASDLGIDLAAQVWHRSGHGDGAIEIAFARARNATASSTNTNARTGDTGARSTNTNTRTGNTAPAAGNTAPTSAEPLSDRAEWVLMRVAGDPDQRVLVFDRHEWECFLDGARNGEFDDAAASP